MAFGSRILMGLSATVLCFSFIQGQTPAVQDHSIMFYGTMNRLVEEALKNNPSIRAAESRVDGAAAVASSLSAYDPPRVGVEFYQSPVSSFPDPITDQMEIDYSVEQMIPFPGKLSKMARGENIRSEMLKWEAEKLRQEVARSVKQAYIDLYLFNRKRDINAENLALLGQFVEIAKTQYGVGQGRQTDLLRAQTELTMLEGDSIDIGAGLKARQAMLNALLGRAPGSPVDSVPEISMMSCSLAVDKLAALALDNRPDLKAMRAGIRMKEAEAQFAKSEYYPDFAVKGTYKDMKATSDFWALMVSANVPLFFWSKRKYMKGFEEARYAGVEAGATYENMKNMTRAEVEDAYQMVKAAEARCLLVREKLLPQAKLTLESARTAYQTGGADFLMLLDAIKTRLSAQLGLNEAAAECLSNRVKLERAVGLPWERLTGEEDKEKTNE